MILNYIIHSHSCFLTWLFHHQWMFLLHGCRSIFSLFTFVVNPGPHNCLQWIKNEKLRNKFKSVPLSACIIFKFILKLIVSASTQFKKKMPQNDPLWNTLCCYDLWKTVQLDWLNRLKYITKKYHFIRVWIFKLHVKKKKKNTNALKF